LSDSTDSDDEKKRPNANYNLSKPDGAVVPENELVFYYNREHRLSKAPKQVQELYEEKKPSRYGWLGFVGVLVADTPRKIMFFTIILMCILIWLFSFLGFITSPRNLDGNLVSVSASFYEDTTIVVINKKIKGMNAYTGAVDVAVSVPLPERDTLIERSENAVSAFYHRIFFSQEKQEGYSLAVPFKSEELLIVLQTEKNSIKLKVPVKSID
jgi:hypothetical protein